MNQVIEHDRHTCRSFFRDVILSVLKHHHTRRLRSIVLSGRINPVLSNRPWKTLALKHVIGHFTCRHTILPLRIRAQRVERFVVDLFLVDLSGIPVSKLTLWCDR